MDRMPVSPGIHYLQVLIHYLQVCVDMHAQQGWCWRQKLHMYTVRMLRS
jgi:hypothetical protein